ncbi:MAG: nucleotide exchange factor GrpE [candidate division WOR-3 bacterium]
MIKERKGPVSEMRARLLELEQQATKFREEYLRALADFDNFRKRVERDLVQTRRLAVDELIAELLTVLDNFERALAAAAGNQEMRQVMPDTSSPFQKGIEMIHRQLCDVLAKYGLQRYSCLGEVFDPRRAEAIGFVETDDHCPDTVVQELCAGYECSGRILRPARVMVARPKRTESNQTAESASDVRNHGNTG